MKERGKAVDIDELYELDFIPAVSGFISNYIELRASAEYKALIQQKEETCGFRKSKKLRESEKMLKTTLKALESKSKALESKSTYSLDSSFGVR